MNPFFEVIAKKRVAGGGGGGTADLIDETFEGTGEPSGWAHAHTVNYDYTGVVLAGAQSCRLTNVANAGVASYVQYNLGSGKDELWTKILARQVVFGAASVFFKWVNPAFGDEGVIYYIPGSGLTQDFVNYATFTTGTTYFVWTHIHKSATCDVWTNTVNNRSGGSHVTFAGSGNQIQYAIWVGGVTDLDDTVIDNVQVSSTDIF